MRRLENPSNMALLAAIGGPGSRVDPWLDRERGSHR
jgi:hypothetical protein